MWMGRDNSFTNSLTQNYQGPGLQTAIQLVSIIEYLEINEITWKTKHLYGSEI